VLLMPAWTGLASPQDLLLFMAAVFVLNATPGVDLLLTVTRTLRGGVRAGMAAALGINAGCVVHALAAAFGLAALLAVSAAAFAVLKWVGAAYLLWLAVGMWREAWAGRPVEADASAGGPRSFWADFRVGLLTNLLNPKVVIFFLAFLPQFIAPGTPDTTLAFVVLGMVFVAQSTVFLAVVVALSARARRIAWPQGADRVLQALGGALFAALALRLALAPHGKA
jgi:RhtB (resistance to homoserine/threonine) family protein